MTTSKETREASDSFELGFGAGAYIQLGICGFVALLPASSWITSICFGLFGEGRATGPQNAMLGLIAVVSTVLGILVAPWAVPALMLRGRQWNGARVVVEEDAVVEYDGRWRRTVIPWANAMGARVEWDSGTRMRRTRSMALQIRDRRTGTVISLWTDAPIGTDAIRRRVFVEDAHPIELSLKARGLAFDQPFDALAAADPERPIRPTWVRFLARTGYFFGFMAPLAVYPSLVLGLACACLGTALLAVRAEPVFSELVALRRSLRAVLEPPSRSVGVDPYRVIGVAPFEIDPAEARARRLKLRAVTAEATVRGLCVVLPIVSTVAAWSSTRSLQ